MKLVLLSPQRLVCGRCGVTDSSLGRGPGVWLNVDTPDHRIEVECGECTLSAEIFKNIDVLGKRNSLH